MNEFQQTLYSDLMALCSPEQDVFYYSDHRKGTGNYRIFLYRLAPYQAFLKPSALECRGHTFEIDEKGNALRLASLPMAKFFGLDENPFTMGLDLSKISHVGSKLDGSLISTVTNGMGGFFLKSKGSFGSPQAQWATELLFCTDEYKELHDFCDRAAQYDWTVNMEYLAPFNRIVIGYDKPTLKILNVRSNFTGAYLNPDWMPSNFVVDSHPLPENGEEWVKSVYEMTGIEGFVIRFEDGLTVKLKTEAYRILHRTKDSVTVPRKLFEACVCGKADDLRSMFATDTGALSLINEMEAKVSVIYNRLHKSVHAFYQANKGLDRKSYAIKGQVDADLSLQGAFGLVMNLYLGKEANIEEFLVKHYSEPFYFLCRVLDDIYGEPE